jgi:hypothetical protein
MSLLDVSVFGDCCNLESYFPEEPIPVNTSIEYFTGGKQTMTSTISRYNKELTSDAGYVELGFFNQLTNRGDCGLAVFCGDEKRSAIAGILVTRHEALGNSGFSCVTADRYARLVEKMSIMTPTLCKADYDGLNPRINLQTDPHPKSPVNFMPDVPEMAEIDYCGDVPVQETVKFKTQVHPWREAFEEEFIVPNLLPAEPNTKVIRTAMGLSNFEGPTPDLNVLNEVTMTLGGTLSSLIKKTEFEGKVTRPYTADEVINGIDGHPYRSAMRKDTSSGYPYNGKKMDALREVNGRYEFTPTYDEEMKLFIQKIRDGKLPGNVYKASIKDEGRPEGKHKTPRVFQAPCVVAHVVFSMFMGPVLDAMQSDPRRFRNAVGVSPFSRDWGEAIGYIHETGRLPLDLDFGSFDLTHYIELRERTGKIFVMCACALYGYELGSEECLFLERLYYCCVNTPILMKGNIVFLQSMWPSGIPPTAAFGAIAVLIVLEYAWYMKILKPKIDTRTFYEAGRSSGLGDDLTASLTEEFRGKFTCKHIAEAAFQFGMKVTSPDKSDTITDYSDPNKIDYLKRRTRFHPSFGFPVGVLQPSSIFRPMATILRSREVFFLDQTFSQIDSMLNELCLHGPEPYELAQRKFVRVLAKFDVTVPESMRLSYEQRVTILAGHCHPWTDDCPPEYLHVYHDKEEILSYMRVNTSNMGEPDLAEPTGVEQQGVTEFVDRSETHQNVADTNTAVGVPAFQHITSQYGLDREVSMGTFIISPSTETRFMSTNRLFGSHIIAGRLLGVYGLRADIELRFQVSASDAHYGLVRVDVLPIPLVTSIREPSDAPLLERLCRQSGRQHVDINIGAGERNVKLLVPWHCNKELIPVEQLEQWAPRIQAVMATPLRHAFDLNQPISIGVYGCLKNVQFGAATSRVPQNLRSAVDVNHSNMGEPVSNALHTISVFGETASRIFEGSPLQLPSEIISKMSSLGEGVARTFGFSRNLTPSTSAYVPMMSMPLVVADCDGPGRTLSLYQNQTVSPMFVEKSHQIAEPLHFSQLFSRWRLFDKFTVSTMQARGTLLFARAVHPEMAIRSSGGEDVYYFPPWTAVQSFFAYWAGEMEYHFKIVSTPRFGGKLLVGYDPVSTNVAPDTSRTMIVDLRDTNEFIVKVGHSENFGAFRCRRMGEQDRDQAYEEYTNGIISVRVETPLTTVTDSFSAIDILVSARCPNLRFFAPHAHLYEEEFVHETNIGTLSVGQTDALQGLVGDPNADYAVTEFTSASVPVQTTQPSVVAPEPTAFPSFLSFFGTQSPTAGTAATQDPSMAATQTPTQYPTFKNTVPPTETPTRTETVPPTGVPSAAPRLDPTPEPTHSCEVSVMTKVDVLHAGIQARSGGKITMTVTPNGMLTYKLSPGNYAHYTMAYFDGVNKTTVTLRFINESGSETIVTTTNSEVSYNKAAKAFALDSEYILDEVWISYPRGDTMAWDMAENRMSAGVVEEIMVHGIPFRARRLAAGTYDLKVRKSPCTGADHGGTNWIWNGSVVTTQVIEGAQRVKMNSDGWFLGSSYPAAVNQSNMGECPTLQVGTRFDDNRISRVYAGEMIESFRPMLKFYTLEVIYTIQPGETLIAINHYCTPLERARVTPLEFVLRTYLGARGSMHRFIRTDAKNVTVEVHRPRRATVPSTSEYQRPGQLGVEIYHSDHMPGLHFRSPFYSTRSYDIHGIQSSRVFGYTNLIPLTVQNRNDFPISLAVYVAVGDDFQVIEEIALPRVQTVR